MEDEGEKRVEKAMEEGENRIQRGTKMRKIKRIWRRRGRR